MSATIKKRTTLLVDAEDIKRDKKKIKGLRNQMDKCDKMLRNLEKDVKGLSFIESSDLTKLNEVTDDFKKARKDLLSLFNEKTSPENWSKEK